MTRYQQERRDMKMEEREEEQIPPVLRSHIGPATWVIQVWAQQRE